MGLLTSRGGVLLVPKNFRNPSMLLSAICVMTNSDTKRIERDRVYTTAEASELLGVRPCTVRKWAREGVVPCERVGLKLLRFRGNDLLRVVARSVVVNENEQVAP